MVCNLCPRRCGAVRTETHGAGRCRMPAAPVLARAALHRWEEPPISGTRGSGTVFFLSLIHISEPTRQEAIAYAVFCLKKFFF